MNNKPSTPAENIDYSQSRDWTRFPPDQPEMWAIVDGDRKMAAILDESFGGIGVTLEMAGAVNVQVGDPLTVLHYDCPTPGRVQWIQRTPESQMVRLGIRWSS